MSPSDMSEPSRAAVINRLASCSRLYRHVVIVVVVSGCCCCCYVRDENGAFENTHSHIHNRLTTFAWDYLGELVPER